MQPARASSVANLPYKSGQPSFLVPHSSQRYSVPVEIFGIIFGSVPPEQLYRFPFVCRQWKNWMDNISNIRSYLISQWPNRKDEVTSMTDEAVKAAFRNLVKLILNMISHKSLCNNSLVEGEVLDCSFKHFSTDSTVSYITPINNRQGFRIITSDRSELLAIANQKVNCAVHTDQRFLFIASNTIHAFHLGETTARALYTLPQNMNFEKIEADGDNIVALNTNRMAIVLCNLAKRIHHSIVYTERIYTYRVSGDKCVIAFNERLNIKDCSSIEALKKSPKEFMLAKGQYISAMCAKYGKVYMGNNKGDLSVLDMATETFDKSVKIDYSMIRSLAVEDCFLFALTVRNVASTVFCFNRITRTLIRSIHFVQSFQSVYFGLGMMALGTENSGIASYDYNPVKKEPPVKKQDIIPMEL